MAQPMGWAILHCRRKYIPACSPRLRAGKNIFCNDPSISCSVAIAVNLLQSVVKPKSPATKERNSKELLEELRSNKKEVRTWCKWLKYHPPFFNKWLVFFYSFIRFNGKGYTCTLCESRYSWECEKICELQCIWTANIYCSPGSITSDHSSMMLVTADTELYPQNTENKYKIYFI